MIAHERRWAAGLAVAVAGTALLGAGPNAAAQTAPRADYRDTFTTKEPGASTGRRFVVDIFNPDDRAAKPSAISHVLLQLAPGSRFNTRDTPQCKATDAEISVRGPSACPPDSKVGEGAIEIDTGFPGAARMLNANTTFFNNEGELIIVNSEASTGFPIVLRGKIGVDTLEIEVPPLPGTPPDGGADSGENVFFAPRTTRLAKGVAHYLTTPATCPASGQWVNRLTYTFRDGVKQTFESASACERRPGRGGGSPGGGSTAGAGPSRSGGGLRLTRTCIGRGRLRMNVRDLAGARTVQFKLGKRLVHEDGVAPYQGVLDRRTLATTRATRLRSVITMPAGPRRILARTLPRCGLVR